MTSGFGSARARWCRDVDILTIDTTLDPDVSVLITGSTIAGVEESRVWLGGLKSETTPQIMHWNTNPHVGVEVTVMVLPDGPGD